MATELENKNIQVIGTGPDNQLSDLSSKNLNSVKLDPTVTHVLFGFDTHFSHTKGTLTNGVAGLAFVRQLS